MRSLGKIATLVKVVIAPILITHMFVCAKAADQYPPHSSAEVTTREEEQSLVKRVDEGSKLDRSELSSLSALLLMASEYDKAIALLGRLARDDRYTDEMDDLYFHLSLFYFAKAEASKDQEQSAQWLKQSEQHLYSGFEATHEKAMAYYKRAKAYSAMGCVTKAIADMHEAIRLAEGKELIDYGEGIFLAQREFTRILNGDIGRLEKSPDECRVQ